MSILKKIAKLKREQDEHSARIDAALRKEEAIVQSRTNKMFNAFRKYISELNRKKVEGSHSF